MQDNLFIAQSIASISGIPVRLYDKTQKTDFFSSLTFPCDPFEPLTHELDQNNRHISLVTDDPFLYYGIVRKEDIKMVLGPCSEFKPAKQELLKKAFWMGLSGKEAHVFVECLENIPSFPLVSFVEMLCMINFLWNNERLSSKEVLIQSEQQSHFQDTLAEERVHRSLEQGNESSEPHNTYLFEQKMTRFIKEGDWPSLETLFTQIIPARSGKLSSNQLRQSKNLFIVSATLASRAAVEGGLDQESAFSLSDAYIQRCELLDDLEAINNLQYHMIKDYTAKVHQLVGSGNDSKTVIQVKHYIQANLSKKIRVADLVKIAFLSRSHLEERFKKETGMTLSEYIAHAKIEEAKMLLSHSRETISAISEYLGFSSQSHFQNVFKKAIGDTPRVYREKTKKEK